MVVTLISQKSNRSESIDVAAGRWSLNERSLLNGSTDKGSNQAPKAQLLTLHSRFFVLPKNISIKILLLRGKFAS